MTTTEHKTHCKSCAQQSPIYAAGCPDCEFRAFSSQRLMGDDSRCLGPGNGRCNVCVRKLQINRDVAEGGGMHWRVHPAIENGECPNFIEFRMPL